MVGPFDQHSHLGRRALLRFQHADFVVGEADVGDAGIQRGQTLAEAQVERVTGPCPEAVAECTPSCALILTVPVVVEGREPDILVVTSKLITSKNCMPRVQRLAYQQFERALGGFELVTHVLDMLDALEQSAPRFFAEALVKTLLLELIQYVATSGQISDQHALVIAHARGLDVFVGRRVLQHRATWMPPLCANALWPT